MRFVQLLGALSVVIVLLVAPAHAHPALSSAVYLEFTAGEVKGELQLPVDQLEMALERPLERSGGGLSGPEVTALASYLVMHLGLTSPGGSNWALAIESIGLSRIDDADHVLAEVRATAPPGGSSQQLMLSHDVILHRVVTHKIFVLARRDAERGLVDGDPRPLGTLRYQHATLLIDRSDASRWKAFQALFSLGARHIAEGSDHLLFLLILLLPAPLVAKGRRWSALRSFRASAAQIGIIVSAFTLGHSLTLGLGAAGVLRLPSRPVEVLIAASIALSAVHAVVPIFPRREFAIAAGFGLIHGLAFSGVLSELGLCGGNLALSLLAFNLGIEAMQLAVVAVTAPWIILLAQSRRAAPIRLAGAAFGGCAAVLWAGERALGWPNPFGKIVDDIFAHPVWAFGVLATVTSLAVVLRPIRKVRPSVR